MKNVIVFAVLVVFFIIPQYCWSQSDFSYDGYAAFLENIANLTSGEQLSRHKPAVTYYKGGLPPSLQGITYLDSVILKYNLTGDEIQLLERNKFVVTERFRQDCFGRAFHTVYGYDLPVFVSTDAVLYALHMSYDRILMNLEQDILEPNLVDMLESLSRAFPAMAEKYGGDERLRENLADVDLYVTMARSLLADEKLMPSYCDSETFDAVWDAARDEKMTVMPLFSEIDRNLDFSQLTVRGHYVNAPGKKLEPYFRCMMWLGRIDFMLTPPPDFTDNSKWEADVRRMSVDAVIMNELIDAASVRDLLDENGSIIDFMIGESDNLTPGEFSEVIAALGIGSAGVLLDDTAYEAFREKMESSADYGQRILSNFFIMNPTTAEPDPLPVSYRLMGQRFVIDSYVFSNVVYDRIINNGAKVWRPMPDPLDAMFVLGNDDALPLLSEELERYHYSPQLEALRYLADAYDRDFWRESLYNTWLDALRCLNPPDDDTGFPLFMKTSAWHQEKLNTQLASWSQLRHDTLLYAKQSYTGGTLCSFPHSYVEPYPAFYRTLGDFAERAEAFFAPYPEDTWNMRCIKRYFPRLKDTMLRLETIAEKELAGQPFTAEEAEFLSKMLFTSSGSGAPPFSGWYAELFYDMEMSGDVDYVIADVHTQPTDEFGNVVGRVLHVGTGMVNLGVFIAESPSNGFLPTAFVGPVMSYYETITDDFDRLTDERWSKLVAADDLPERPDWVNIYLADKDGSARAQGRELPGVPYTGVYVEDGEAEPAAFLTAGCYPNPFNPATTITYTLAAGSRVEVAVFDILGRKIATLADGVRDAGAHTVVWDASGHASGVYFCRITAGASEKSFRMTLVR